MTGLFVIVVIVAGVLWFVWDRMPEHRGKIMAAGTAVSAVIGAAWQWIAGVFGG